MIETAQFSAEVLCPRFFLKQINVGTRYYDNIIALTPISLSVSRSLGLSISQSPCLRFPCLSSYPRQLARVRACVRACVGACVRVCVRACVPACLCACLLPCLPFGRPACMHACPRERGNGFIFPMTRSTLRLAPSMAMTTTIQRSPR